MRESVGATWIFSICLTFIILFTAYLAISVNYARAFRIKNHIISNIEEAEGYNGDDAQNIENYLISSGYNAFGKCENTIRADGIGDTDWQLAPSGCLLSRADGSCGACVYVMEVNTGNDDLCAERAYYRVVTWFKFDLPVVNVLLNFKVSGDSRYIYDFANC